MGGRDGEIVRNSKSKNNRVRNPKSKNDFVGV